MDKAVTEKRLSTPWGGIYYWVSRAEESSPWLVFLPGLTADHHLFDKQMEAFRDNYNCLSWDAPAHGKSRPFQLRFTMDDLAGYLHQIFALEGIGNPVLVGQSLGGYISQVYMELYPGVVSGFVSVDSGPMKISYYTSAERALMRRTRWMYMSIPWKALIKWGADGNAQSEYGRQLMQSTMEGYKKAEFCTLTDYGFRMLIEAIELERDYDINCPVLLICGEKDGAGSIKKYNRSWTKTEGHELVWIPDAGHNANTDSPELINRLIGSFVSTL